LQSLTVCQFMRQHRKAMDMKEKEVLSLQHSPQLISKVLLVFFSSLNTFLLRSKFD
jgi:hypothetical protein